jgi:hypothetical protein
MPYCYPCNRKFPSAESLHQHRKSSSRHNCERCRKSFKSPDAKKQHVKTSSRHHICAQCRHDFDTEKALRQHRKSHHSIVAKPGRAGVTFSPSTNGSEYMGTLQTAVAPVFDLARRLRFTQPDADTITHRSKTQLDRAIVCSLIDAALRLLPLDNSPDGIQRRREKHRIKLEEAQLAEMQFTESVRNLGYIFLTEMEQREPMISPTPDIRFLNPIRICGHLCFWLEYKNYFGFRANPFLASQNRKQFKKYTAEIGPGAVVYKLGFETNHLNINRVKAFREKELLQCLEATSLM